MPVEAGYHIGLLERERLHVVTQEGVYKAWNFDPVNRALTFAPTSPAVAEAYRQRVINTFAPAYQWFYGLPQKSGNLAGVDHADVTGE